MTHWYQGSATPGGPQDPPPHWPGAVRLPDTPGFEQSAKAWLFDLAPSRWRFEQLLHRRPVELARMVRLRLEANALAMRAAPVTHPSPNADPAEALEVLEVYRHEREWATTMWKQVREVEEALGAAAARSAATMATMRRTVVPAPRRAAE